jgi:FkbM family methyltransferase
VSTHFRAPIPNSSRRVLLRLGTTDVAAFEHVFVNDEYALPLAKEPSVVVDAGANIGMSAIYFAVRYPNARIIAIEPDARNFGVLKQNVESYPMITPVNAALWNQDGVVSLQDAPASAWGVRVSAVATGDLVRSITLPTLLKEFQIERVDLFKIDIEGAERELFEDASEWIGGVNVICAELHDRFRPGCSAAFEHATAAFHTKWRRGELKCVAREGAVFSPDGPSSS